MLYSWKTFSPPGKDEWLRALTPVTSQGSRREVTDMTVSRPVLAENCCSVHGKASIEPYLAPTSSAKERRDWMFSRPVTRSCFLPFLVKKVALQPAT